MSDVRSKIKKELETLSCAFVVLLDVPAENYFDAIVQTADVMSKRGKGVYVTASRPYRHISEKMQKRNINTNNISFIDCVSAMSGGDEDENLYAFVLAVELAVGRVASIIQEFAFLFTRWAFVRGRVSLQRIPAVRAFPTWHGNTSSISRRGLIQPLRMKKVRLSSAFRGRS